MSDDVHRLIKDEDRTLNFLAKTLINCEEIIRTRSHRALPTLSLKVVKGMIDRQSDREYAAKYCRASFISLTYECFSNIMDNEDR